MGLELWKEVIIIPALALVTSNWLNFCLSFCFPYSLSWVNNDTKSLFSLEHVCPVVPFPVWKSGFCQLVKDLLIILEYIEKQHMFTSTSWCSWTMLPTGALLTSPPLDICCQIFFHFYTIHMGWRPKVHFMLYNGQIWWAVKQVED